MPVILTCHWSRLRCNVCLMKTKWILSSLLLVATVAAFWFLRPTGNVGRLLGFEAHALTGEILAIGSRPPGSVGLDTARALMAKELKSAGWVVVLQEFERDTPVGKVKFANLRARFAREGDPWKKKVKGLLCAHLDSKTFNDRTFLGADDAASACAAVAVIGKLLARDKPEQAEQLELVLFDGEEAFAKDMTTLDGLYGSRHYANQWRGSDDKPGFGILLDMIGHENLSIRIPSDSPKDLAERMFSAAKEEDLAGHFGTAPTPIMDDHLPLNLVGIPTLDIIGDFSRKAWWHTTGDNESIISAESLGISIRVVLRMLDGLLLQ